MEYVKCNFCGEKEARQVYTCGDYMYSIEDRFNIVACNNCGLMYVNPRPDSNEISRFYPEGYFKFYHGRGLVKNIKKWVKRSLIQGHVKELKGLIGAGARILDAGCGDGEYLSLLKKFGGWDTLGVEPNSDAAGVAREQYGVNVVEDTFEKAKLDTNSFDLLILSNTLEHLHDPFGCLKKVNSLLRMGGKLLLSVPCTGSTLECFLGQYWGGYDVPRHLYYYTEEVLEKMLQGAGFSVIRRKYNYLPSFLIAGIWSYFKHKKISVYRYFDHRNNIFLGALLFPITYLFAKIGKGDQIQLFAEKTREI